MKRIKWMLIGILMAAIPLCMAFFTLPKAYFLSKPTCNDKSGTQEINDLTSADYQLNVIKILETKKPEDFRYFFKTFIQNEENTYMVVNFRNKAQCFDAMMKVKKWDKLEGMKKTNGLAYPEELFDLEWKLDEVSGKKEIIYQDMHTIID